MDKHGNGGMQLLDEQWKKMEPLLLGKPGDPGVSAKSNRLFIEGMLWVAMNNGSWGNLPIRFGKMNTAYMRFRRWNMRGIWRQLVESKVDDQELQWKLEQILLYADLYTERARERLRRRPHRISCNVQVNVATNLEPVDPTTLLPDESTLHWVRLVMPHEQI